MKHYLTLTIVTLATTLTACSSEAPTQNTSVPAPDVMVQNVATEITAKAVLVHADWCGSCKVIDPKLGAIKAGFQAKGVEFITLDYTAKDPAIFFAQAEAMGVKYAVERHLGGTVKTGQVILLNADGSQISGTITKADSEAVMSEKLMAAIAS